MKRMMKGTIVLLGAVFAVLMLEVSGGVSEKSSSAAPSYGSVIKISLEEGLPEEAASFLDTLLMNETRFVPDAVLYSTNVRIPKKLTPGKSPSKSSGGHSRLRKYTPPNMMSSKLKSIKEKQLQTVKMRLDECRLLKTESSERCRKFQSVYDALQRKMGRASQVRKLLDNSEASGFRCSMSSCFNRSRCSRDNFSIFVYPDDLSKSPKRSHLWQAILDELRALPFITENPHEACLLFPSIDLISRDERDVSFLPNGTEHLQQLPYWNGGENHVIFIMQMGTYPLYLPTLDVDIGKAILVSSSHLAGIYRYDFDIAFPHMKPHESMDPLSFVSESGKDRPYLASFKGSVYNSHPLEVRERATDVATDDRTVLLFKCQGKSKDPDRVHFCKQHERTYDAYDYHDLMRNSTFSIVLGGRRPATYRFIEAIWAGAIPVVAANAFVPPFPESIDWSQASVFIDEEYVQKIPAILKAMTREQIDRLQRGIATIHKTMLGSLAKIVFSVIRTVQQRLWPLEYSETWKAMWQPEWLDASDPRRRQMAALSAITSPYQSASKSWTTEKYTVVMLGHDRMPVLMKSIHHTLSGTSRIDKLIVVLNDPTTRVDMSTFPLVYFPIEVHTLSLNSLNNRFLPFPSIQTHAVFHMDDDIRLPPDAVEFAFDAWKENVDVIVGFPARQHVYNPVRGRWEYGSEDENAYSMILTGAAFVDASYLPAYSVHMNREIYGHVAALLNCEDIAMNFLVANTSSKAMIKIGPHAKFTCAECSEYNSISGTTDQLRIHFQRRSDCINLFENAYGHDPLRYTYTRVDPFVYDGMAAKGVKEKRYPSFRPV